MNWIANITVFLASCAILYYSGELVVSSLVRLSRLLGLREFVVAFFVMAFAASLPNLFVGITSALDGVPQLSLGDVFGNNFIALTLAVAVAVLFSPKKEIQIQSQTIKDTSIFAICAAVLPVILMADGTVSRTDGLILLSLFAAYIIWLFSKKERFSKVYGNRIFEFPHHITIKESFRNLSRVFAGAVLLLVAAQGIVFSASSFAAEFAVPISLIGLLIVGFGNALPEVYFSIASARRGETFMIMGNLLGSVIVPASVVLGIVSVISPIVIQSGSFLIISRFFMVAAAASFLLFSRTRNTISRNESYILLVLYSLFLVSVIILI